MVVTESEVESFAFGDDVYGEDGVSEEHIVPFDFSGFEFSGHGVVSRVSEFVSEVPSLEVMDGHGESDGCVCEAVVKP